MIGCSDFSVRVGTDHVHLVSSTQLVHCYFLIVYCADLWIWWEFHPTFAFIKTDNS